MIHLTNLEGRSFVLNADLILTIESTPDTRITLTDDRKFIVKETTDEVVERVLRYQRAVHGHLPTREERA